jgi:hypothetical protein
MTIQVISLKNIKIDKQFKADLMVTPKAKDMRGVHLFNQLRSNVNNLWFLSEEPFKVHNTDAQSGSRFDQETTFSLSVGVFKETFREWLSSSNTEIPHIVVDISCMSRPTMAEVFGSFFSPTIRKRFTVTVGYVIAEFTPPPENLPPNEDIRPISEEFAGWPSSPVASTALIVGLGYEREKAEGACEYFDTNETRVFIPSSPVNAYDISIQENNKRLLARVKRRNHSHVYEVNNAEQTFGKLVAVTSDLVTRSNPVILPFGPKIFFVLSLVVAQIYKEVGVWYVTGDTAQVQNDFKPSEHIVGFSMELSPANAEL